jgi:hypothetical protein
MLLRTKNVIRKQNNTQIQSWKEADLQQICHGRSAAASFTPENKLLYSPKSDNSPDRHVEMKPELFMEL